MDLDFKAGGKLSEFSIRPMSAIGLLNLLLLRLMQRPEPDVMNGLQLFALAEIEAKRTMNGQIFLQYKMENWLAFGSGLEREKLEARHRQLTEVLVLPEPDGEMTRLQ